MLLWKAVVKIVRSELKLKWIGNFSQNYPMLNLIKTGLSVQDLIHA
jgi:hypothetical protein